MKEVIYINQDREDKPVEFTHTLDISYGWQKTSIEPTGCENIVYLGCCVVDGDMFSAKTRFDTIVILKGHLNSGKY